MTRTPAQALNYLALASHHDAPFDPGMCKQRTRLAYGVPSDGSADATEAWSRTKHRLSGTSWVPGALRWWTGGSQGHGHVTIDDAEPGYTWSVDVLRPGRWDRVPVARIGQWAPGLTFAGRSLDIDGVQVVPTPEKATPDLDLAIHYTQSARWKGKRGSWRWVQLGLALRILRAVRTASKAR